MNKAKLKVLVMALKEILEELESEVYSDVDAYQSMQVSASKKLDYDEMYDLSLIHISEPTRPY